MATVKTNLSISSLAVVTSTTGIVSGSPLDPPVGTRSRGGLLNLPWIDSISGGVEDSDTTPLYGPDLEIPLKADVTAWEATSWLPDRTRLSVYAKALFGEFELFGFESDLELYSVGLRLSMPVVETSSWDARACVSAGPAWLLTDLGNATGVDTGIGVDLRLALTRSLSILGGIELNAFFTENLVVAGPAVSFGLNLSW